MKRILLSIVLFIFSFSTIIASFQPIKSTLYFENISTKEIEYYETISYNKQGLIDLYFLKYLDEKIVGKDIIFEDWLLKEYCFDDECFSNGIINKGVYAIYLNRFKYDEFISTENSKDNSIISEFDISNIEYSNKFNNIYLKIFLSLLLEFVIFLPLNLYIFFFVGYLFYKIFSKYITKNSYLIIYIISFFSYLISFLLLYNYGLGFQNFNSVNFGFMSYLMIIGFPKFLLLFLSKDLLKQYKKDNSIKSNYEFYIFIYYLIVFALFILYINLFI